MAELGTHFTYRKSETGNPQPKGDPRRRSTQQADLEPNAYGYRPRRSAQDAIREVHELLCEGYTDVVDADLS